MKSGSVIKTKKIKFVCGDIDESRTTQKMRDSNIRVKDVLTHFNPYYRSITVPLKQANKAENIIRENGCGVIKTKEDLERAHEISEKASIKRFKELSDKGIIQKLYGKDE